MTHTPTHIVTFDGKVYSFNSWYMMSVGTLSWLAAACTDADGNAFAVNIKNIKTKIYNAEQLPSCRNKH